MKVFIFIFMILIAKAAHPAWSLYINVLQFASIVYGDDCWGYEHVDEEMFSLFWVMYWLLASRLVYISPNLCKIVKLWYCQQQIQKETERISQISGAPQAVTGLLLVKQTGPSIFGTTIRTRVSPELLARRRPRVIKVSSLEVTRDMEVPDTIIRSVISCRNHEMFMGLPRDSSSPHNWAEVNG
jgi:hypothetical protein